VFVADGVTLTIQPGAVVYAEPVSVNYVEPAVCDAASCTADNECIFVDGTCQGFTSTLVVLQGGKLNAAGTAENPITFTPNMPAARLVVEDLANPDPDVDSSTGALVASVRGWWGGLIILGRANIKGSTRSIEGLVTPTPYGGTDDNDSSGVLQYVRVWYGGARIAADNEINGITFGGVGAGTIVDHCEVAFNVDDGFEFFGGNVNAKYLSTLFVGDDAFDTDKGYTGKLQNIYAMLGSVGHHAAEMDADYGNAERSAPQVMGATFIGSASNAGSDGGHDTMMRLREGTGGAFGNMAIAKKSMVPAIKHDRCFATSARVEGTTSGEVVTQSRSAVAQCAAAVTGPVSSSAGTICGLDTNMDNIVGVDDLLALLASYGRSTEMCGFNTGR